MAETRVTCEASSPVTPDKCCCTRIVGPDDSSTEQKSKRPSQVGNSQSLSSLKPGSRPGNGGGGVGARALNFPLGGLVEGHQFRDGPLQLLQGQEWLNVYVLMFVNGLYMFGQEISAMRSLAWCPFSEVRWAKAMRAGSSDAEVLPFHIHFHHEGQRVILGCSGEDAEERRRRWIDDIMAALRERASLLFPPRPLGRPVDVRPLEEVPQTATRILAGYLLHASYDRHYDPVLLLYCELRAHSAGSAMLVMYTDEACREVFDGIVLTGANMNNDLRKDGDVGFVIQRHRFRARSVQETTIWLRAIQNVCVKLLHAAPDPTEQELEQFRDAVLQRAQELESEAAARAKTPEKLYAAPTITARGRSQAAVMAGKNYALPSELHNHQPSIISHVNRHGVQRPPQPMSPSTPGMSTPPHSPPTFSSISAVSAPLTTPSPARRRDVNTASAVKSLGTVSSSSSSSSSAMAATVGTDVAPLMVAPATVVAASCGGRRGMSFISVGRRRSGNHGNPGMHKNDDTSSFLGSRRRRCRSCPAPSPRLPQVPQLPNAGDDNLTDCEAVAAPTVMNIRKPLSERLGLDDAAQLSVDKANVAAAAALPRSRRWTDVPRTTHVRCNRSLWLQDFPDANAGCNEKLFSQCVIPVSPDAAAGAAIGGITDVSTGEDGESGGVGSGSPDESSADTPPNFNMSPCDDFSMSSIGWSPGMKVVAPRSSAAHPSRSAEAVSKRQMQQPQYLPTASPAPPLLPSWLMTAPSVHECAEYEALITSDCDADDDEDSRPAIPCARQAWPGLDCRQIVDVSPFSTPPRMTPRIGDRTSLAQSRVTTRGAPRAAPKIACVMTPPSPPLVEPGSPLGSPMGSPMNSRSPVPRECMLELQTDAYSQFPVSEERLQRECGFREASEAESLIRSANATTWRLAATKEIIPMLLPASKDANATTWRLAATKENIPMLPPASKDAIMRGRHEPASTPWKEVTTSLLSRKSENSIVEV